MKKAARSHNEKKKRVIEIGDELRVRRMTKIALQFMNTRTPLSSQRIWTDFYPELSKRDSFRKAFQRDRADLARCGIFIERHKRPGSDTLWHIDKQRSFVSDAQLNISDAFLLEYVCSPLISDPSFPYAEDLLLALGKVNNCFGANFPLPQQSENQPRQKNKVLDAVQKALRERKHCIIEYKDAQGKQSRRTICCYGMFTLRNNTYVVAATHTGQDQPDHENIRTYNIARIRSIELDEKSSYSIPDDFFTCDYILLPFQIGSMRQAARFLLDPLCEEEFQDNHASFGSFHRQGNVVIWNVDVADIDATASWAIAHSLVPLDPPELCQAWRTLLEEALHEDS